jgi:hypothetical protein
MRKCLRRITHLLPAGGNFFGEHVKMIRISQHVLEDVDGANEVVFFICAGLETESGNSSLSTVVLPRANPSTYPSQSFNEPECAHRECTLSAADAFPSLADGTSSYL